MSRTIELYLGTALLALILGLAGYSWYEHHRVDNKQESLQSATGDAYAHETYATGYKKVVEQRKTDEQEVRAVLARNPEWSDDVVPDDVADLLRHDSGSTSAVP